MIINNINVTVFSYKTSISMDTDGHQHPGPEQDTDMAILAIETDEDITGYCFGSPQTLRPYLLENYIKLKEKDKKIIKEKLLKYFDVLGNSHEQTKTYRRKLSSVYFK